MAENFIKWRGNLMNRFRSKPIVLFLFFIFFANACSTSSTVTANQFKGKNVLFFVSAVTCGICRAQLMELNEVWDTLVNEDVNIYVFTHGDQKDKKFVNEFMDLKFEVNMLDDFSFPKKLGLVNSDKGITSISRGYAIIVDGNLIESKAEDYFAKQAHEIVQRAKMTTIN
jgi:peroxiredoxin